MYSCKVVADSVGPSGCRITTLEVTYPLAVHWDFLRHQSFSMYEQVHSVASNRAIPTNTYLRRIIEDPAEPLWWGKNQPGMVAREEMTGWRLLVGKRIHAFVRLACVAGAWAMSKLGFHKEVANWSAMPHAWVTQIVTATDWENFDALRIHPSARAEMRKVATMMRDCRNESTPKELGEGGWHLPYVRSDEIVKAYMENDNDEADVVLRNVSASRCARVSIVKQNEGRDMATEFAKASKLQSDGHMSPFDHPAMALATSERVANLRGFKSARKFIPNEDNFARLTNANG
jgi:hypothetical protein